LLKPIGSTPIVFCCRPIRQTLQNPGDVGKKFLGYYHHCDMADRALDIWVLRNFPDSSPAEIARAADREKSVDLEEYQRAVWLWQRRPSETSILVHLLIFAVGALIHIPLILLDDFVVFALYHTFYVCLVIACVGRFVWFESRYRRWKQDYLRSLARLAGESGSPD
jgi:hypothetical protein